MGIMLSNWFADIFFGRVAIIIYVIILFLLILVFLYTVFLKDQLKEKTIIFDNEYNNLNNRIGIEGAGGSGNNSGPNNNSRTKLTGRFFELTAIDNKLREYQKITEDKTYTLRDICEDFRNFAANDSGGLYYDISEIRHFIAGLGVSHIAIFQGMSGTGKTSLAGSFGRFISNPSTIIPIQPMWKERSDLLGYFNEFTKKFNETTLLEVLYEANYSNKIYIVVLDEMNIARIEYYFAEFLSLLELPKQEDRHIEVVNDHWADDPKLLKDGKLLLPPNVWFIGTANNDDSTFAISDKVYDRAMVLNLNQKGKEFKSDYNEAIHFSSDSFYKLIDEAYKNYKFSQKGQQKVKEIDEYMQTTYHIAFGNRIMKQISNYVSLFVACGGTENEALDDIISKKVLRKLEAKNPNLVRKNIEATIIKFNEIFPDDSTKSCYEYLSRIERGG